jgi:hypothetical protein
MERFAERDSELGGGDAARRAVSLRSTPTMTSFMN